MLRETLFPRRMRKQPPTSEQTMVRFSTTQQTSPAEQPTVRPFVAETTAAEAVAAHATKAASASVPAKATTSPEPASAKPRVCLGHNGQGDRRHQNQHFAIQASCG